jgi:N-acetylglucosamine-6-sulfatase
VTSQRAGGAGRSAALALAVVIASMLLATGPAALAQERPPAPSPGQAQATIGPWGDDRPGPGPVGIPFEAAGSRPNVVVFMLDDIPGDIMPRLLRRMPRSRALFLQRGMHFPNAFVQDPLCCPGRAGFLTGLYASHHGVRVNVARRLQPEETVATALDGAGYHTMLVGKYLNNADALADPVPPGWDHFTAFARSGYRSFSLLVNGKLERFGEARGAYSTDVLATRAVRALRRAPADDPVFLYFSPVSVHNEERGGRISPPPPAPRHAGSNQCDGIGYRRTPAYDERDVSDKPRWIQELDYRSDPMYTPLGYPLEPVCRALLSVDDAVGRIVKELRSQGRYQDTLFVLTADNGMGWGDHRRRAKSVPWASRIPFFVRWERLLGNDRRRVRTWIQNIDLAPTLAEAAGTALGPYPSGQSEPDGLSLLPLLASLGQETLSREALFEDHVDPGASPRVWRTLRTTDQHPLGLWRYTEWRSGERELYDLEKDPWELRNAVRTRRDIARALARELATYPPSRPGS